MRGNLIGLPFGRAYGANRSLSVSSCEGNRFNVLEFF
jgi:hypothetical protein